MTVLLCLVSPASAAVLSFRDVVGGVRIGFVGDVVVSPDGRHVYATSEYGNGIGPTLVAMAREQTGRLSLVQVYGEGPAPGPFCGAGALAVSNDGRHVYVAATCNRRVRVFARDAVGGRVTAVGAMDHAAGRADGLADLFTVALSPDGGHLYALNQGGTALGAFRRDAASGQLT
jgi:6-phosphogluconolactonase (cycloisomerase 2 family)